VVHCGEPLQVPPPRSGRQPDVCTPSWIESPTPSEIIEDKVLLAKVCLLKDRGLTAEAVVVDFVFKNIQPLKDRAYPAYLYSGINDSTRVTNKRIPTEDMMSRLDMILRGRVSNAGAPVAYYAWNLPPHRPFSEFVSNPPASEGSLGLRVRPSLEDIEALIGPLQSLLDDERQTHFEMPASTDDAEIDVVLSLLAGESFDSTHAEPLAITAGQELGEAVETRKPEGARPKRARRVSRPTAPVEEKKKKRQLRRLSCLDQGVGPSAPVHDEVPAEVLPEVDAKGCDRAQAVVCIFDEDEEEEDEVPLIRKNNRHYRGSEGGSDIPSPALSTPVSLQGLSISDFDPTLEEVVPEDMLSEPTAGDILVVRSEVLDGRLSLLDSAGQDAAGVVSRASSTLEGSLQCQDAGLSHPTPMEVTEEPSTLEVVVAGDPAPEGGAVSYPAPEGVAGSDPTLVGSASYDPALEGVQVGSLSHASMDVHVGSSPPRSDGATAVHASTVLNGPVALEVDELDARSLMSTGGAEITPDDALQIVPANLPSSSHDTTLPALGLPQFFSNLQVSRALAHTLFISASYLSSAHLSLVACFCRWNVYSAEILWCHYPRTRYVSNAMESIATSETD
jgi:hypothetical protein